MNKKDKKKKFMMAIKLAKHALRSLLPPNKRHKSKKEYKRKNKVKLHEVEED